MNRCDQNLSKTPECSDTIPCADNRETYSATHSCGERGDVFGGTKEFLLLDFKTSASLFLSFVKCPHPVSDTVRDVKDTPS